MSKSKQRGTRWETAIVDYLRANHFPNAERRTLSGAADRGDINCAPGVVIEAKYAQRHELAAWVDEAELEKANDHADVAAVWAHRRGHSSPGRGYVIMTGAQFVHLLHESGYGNPADPTIPGGAS